MLDVASEWVLQVRDAGDLVVQVLSTRRAEDSTPFSEAPIAASATVTTPFRSPASSSCGLLACVLLSSTVNSDNEPVYVYFDGAKGFAFVRDDAACLDDEEDDCSGVGGEGVALLRPSDFSGGEASFYPSLVGLIQSIPSGANAFGSALAAALMGLAAQQESR